MKFDAKHRRALKLAASRPDVKLRKATGMQRAWNRPGAKIRWGKSIKKSLADPKVKAKRSQSLLIAFQEPKYKEKQSASQKRSWSKRSYRRKVVKGIKAAWKRVGKRWTKPHTYERNLKLKFRSEGWTVLQGGWPDFICIKGKKTLFIEAKGPGQECSKLQMQVHNILKRFGIIVKTVTTR